MLKIEYNGKKNSILSEYISSKVYSMLDIPTQEVILGKIYDNPNNFKQWLFGSCKKNDT